MAEIVAGYDGSERGERALARAARLAEALDSRLVVVSVGSGRELPETAPIAEPELVPTPIGPVLPSAVLSEGATAAPEQPSEEQLLLEHARRFLMPRRVDADYVGEVGDPTERLLAVADARDAELIVVGCHSRGLLDRLLGDGVGTQLARRTSRDVLLVH